MSNILYGKLPQINSRSILHIQLHAVGSKTKFLRELSSKLAFPSFSGKNWDALWDCLRDLSWIKQKHIIIEHLALPQLNNEDFSIYMSILNECVKCWKHYPYEHCVYVIFPKNNEEKISSILRTMESQNLLPAFGIDNVRQCELLDILGMQISNIYIVSETLDNGYIYNSLIVQGTDNSYEIKCEKNSFSTFTHTCLYSPIALQQYEVKEIQHKWISRMFVEKIQLILDKLTDEWIGLQLILSRKCYSFFNFNKRHTITFYHDSDNPKIKHLFVDEPISTDRYYLKDL